MSRKCIVFYWDSVHQEKFLTNEFKYPTFRRFATLANKTFDYFVAFGKETHKSNGVFFPVFQFKDDQLIEYTQEVSADIVMKYDLELNGDRGKARFIYNPEFNELCKDKFKTYNFLREFCPETYICHSKEECIKYAEKIKSPLVVVKPSRGVCGRNVHILEKESLVDLQNLEYNFTEGVLVQEFIDTSHGCPGIAESTHDLRLSIINDKNIMASVSVPREGSLVANWHQGAVVNEVEVANLPKEIVEFRDAVHEKIKKRYDHAMYNIDMAITPSGPKLIELNSPIAFPRPEWKCTDLYLSNLVEHLDVLPLVP